MFGIISRRFFHSSRAHFTASKTSALGKLRKSTGYSVSNCKKAVELFPEDVAKAEEWLHAEAKKQGWSKCAKIQARSATQGLVGVFSRDKMGVMVEVNCETDFVAKNAEFHQLVEKILSGCINHINATPVSEDVTKTVLDENKLNEIKCDTGTLGEMVNAAVNKFNEKTVAKRAVCFKVKDDVDLCSLSHPSTQCPNLQGATLGKYGTLLALRNTSPESITENLGQDVCQHIIGMNPSSLGELTEKDISSFTVEESVEENVAECEATYIEKPIDEKQDIEVQDIVENPEENETETEEQSTVNVTLKDSDETRLLFQPFLLDVNATVGKTLFKAGVEIIDFERFECGGNQVVSESPKSPDDVIV